MAHWTKEIQYSALSSTAVPDQIIDCSFKLVVDIEMTWSVLHEVKRLHFCFPVFYIWQTLNPYEVRNWQLSFTNVLTGWKDPNMQALACHVLDLSPEPSVVDTVVIMLLKDRVGLGNLNIPAGCERGTPNPKKPSLFPLISVKRQHNPIEGFTNICSMEISKEAREGVRERRKERKK